MTHRFFSKYNKSFLFFVHLNPFSSIDKCCHPWSNLIVLYSISRIISILPWETRAFQMRHHGQMATVRTGQTGYAVI